MKASELRDYADNPLFFLAFGVTPFVIGFSALLLWASKNFNAGGAPGGLGSVSRLIQKG